LNSWIEPVSENECESLFVEMLGLAPGAAGGWNVETSGIAFGIPCDPTVRLRPRIMEIEKMETSWKYST
jgi:hypothetical protein